jgi:hypothetical protein
LLNRSFSNRSLEEDLLFLLYLSRESDLLDLLLLNLSLDLDRGDLDLLLSPRLNLSLSPLSPLSPFFLLGGDLPLELENEETYLPLQSLAK